MTSTQKLILIITDGMADDPIPELGYKTPLECAKKTNMERMAFYGKVGRLQTIPTGYPPGSETALLSILGYELNETENSRSVWEAIGMGYSPTRDELLFRCNLVSIEGGVMMDSAGGHISTLHAQKKLESLQCGLKEYGVQFHLGQSYRHLLSISSAENGGTIESFPPHEIQGKQIVDYPIKGTSPLVQRLNELSQKAREILSDDTVANAIWLWAPGKIKNNPNPLSHHLKINKGAVISGVDVVRGIGTAVGLSPIVVSGATGGFDTDLKEKAKATLSALKYYDFVLLHVEAPDEAGHLGDFILKQQMIERIDKELLPPILREIERDPSLKIVLLPDHYTPCRLRKHTDTPVPYLLYGKGVSPRGDAHYDERSVEGLPLEEAKTFLHNILAL